MQLAGITGNRPEALLQLRYKDVGVFLIRDSEGGERLRVLMDWKFKYTKRYRGSKDV